MATMGSSSVTFCILVCICSLHTVAMAADTLHLTHYTHEIRGGPNATFLQAAGPTLDSNLAYGGGWGSLVVYDNMMKAGPDNSSMLMGRVAGTAMGVVSPSTTGGRGTRVQVVMQHVFGEASPYNGSYIDSVGIFFADGGPWEVVVHGCTGSLRGYLGYGICEQTSTSGLDIPIYNIYKWDFYLSKPMYE